MTIFKIVYEVNWLPADTSVTQKLDAMAAQIELIRDELTVIHGLLTGAVQADIDKLTQEINASSDKVEDAINQQTQGE